MSEVGKAAKRMGRQKAAVLKKLDPEPVRNTPAKKNGKKESKPFGLSYEMKFSRGWKRYYRWFKTSTAREQAFDSFKKHYAHSDWVRGLQLEGKQ